MASVREIAKEAGVSITTVSRVINNHPRVSEKAKSKVLNAMNTNRYVAKVGRKSTTNIAFVYTGESSLGSPYDAALMQGMAAGMDEFGFDLMILDARRAKLPHETYTQMFMRKGVRGAVLRTTTNTRHVCQTIADEGFPSVVLGDHFDTPNVNFIYSDSFASSQEATSHLLELGHKRIAIGINVIDDSDHADRVHGYRTAFESHNLPVDERNIIRTPAYREGGMQLIRRIMSMSPRPTAMYLTDPITVVGAMQEAHKMGIKIPDDLSIVGFDDGELRYYVYPQLTAVCQNANEIGLEAFRVLHEKLQNPNDKIAVKKALPTWLEIHDSTGPCNQ
ncbi:LacI family DNA-binding transcriptional regulator [Planctomycetota bacterium]|nr:LacI family DNA-binding transcriptional regulator [Planctomycetota bacterium]